jgi:glutamate-1-semialdehyde 2,1-aminomutase
MADVVTADFARSQAHLARALRAIPGGSHTYAKGDDQYPEGMAPFIERGHGCRVWDLDDNAYVEFGNGLRSTTLGHGHPLVVEAVRGRLDMGVNFVRPHVLEAEAAERLIDLIPSAEMVKFGVNGSDVTTAAIRLARAYTGRDVVAVCRQHPMLSTDDWFIGTTPMSAGVPDATRGLTVQFSYNDLDSLAAVLAAHPGRVAAVVLEAETGEPPAPGFFPGLRELCDREGVLLILDEIITGFRWHERGAQYVHGIEPDLATFGKALGNGFPISALVGRREVMRLGGFTQDRDRVFLLSQTAGAQPWALAAMIAVVDVYQREDIAGQLHEIGSELRRNTDEVVAAAGLADHFQLCGRDCNLVYVARDRDGNPSQAFRTLVMQVLLDHGVLAPSFVVSAAHDTEAMAQTVDAIAAMTASYRRALDQGIGTVLRGRPVRPAIRRRG